MRIVTAGAKRPERLLSAPVIFSFSCPAYGDVNAKAVSMVKAGSSTELTLGLVKLNEYGGAGTAGFMVRLCKVPPPVQVKLQAL